MPRRVLAVVLACAVFPGCTRKLTIEVRLVQPVDPDPFEGLGEVRMRALVSGRIVDVGSGRWDNGPIPFPDTIDPAVERLVVEGYSKDKSRMLASGVSAPLDLLSAPPKSAIPILFTRIGALSTLGMNLGVRRGARAVEIDSERVLLVGGTGASGEALTATEVFDARAMAVQRGPELQAGRTGDFQLRSLPGGEVVVALGSSPTIEVLDPLTSRRFVSNDGLPSVNAGAAVAAVSDNLLLIAGGDDARTGSVSDAVYRFDPQTLSFEGRAVLGRPRSQAASEVVIGGQAVFLGGRSGLDGASALRDAAVFDSSRGSTSPVPVDLGHPAIRPGAKRTAAGGVILAGGSGKDGQPVMDVRAVVIEPVRATQAGDTSSVARLPGAKGGGGLIDLLDGTMLFVPEDPSSDLAWIPLLGGAPEPVPRAAAIGSLAGARGLAGTAALRTEEGDYLWFNAGPSAILGSPGVAELLSGGADRPTAGIVPRRPAAWTIDQGALLGQLLPGVFNQSPAPVELAVLGNSRYGDFDVLLTVRLGSLGQAAFVFGLENGAFDEVAFLGGLTAIQRFDATGARIAGPGCEGVATPAFADGGLHKVRVRRSSDELRVDVGAKGTDDVICTTQNAQPGLFAFGVITGRASLAGLAIATPPLP